MCYVELQGPTPLVAAGLLPPRGPAQPPRGLLHAQLRGAHARYELALVHAPLKISR